MKHQDKLKIFDLQNDVCNRLVSTSSVRVHVQFASERGASLQSVPLKWEQFPWGVPMNVNESDTGSKLSYPIFSKRL